MRGRKLKRAAGALTVLAMLLLQATVAGAHTEDDPSTGEKVLDEESSASVDARLIARANGWRHDATLRHVRESRRFADLAGELAEAHPKTYASATFADKPGQPSLIRFVGEPPEDARAQVERSGLRVDVVGGATYSETALHERAQAVHERLSRSGYQQVVTAAMDDDRILASVYGAGDPELPRELAEGVKVSESREPVAVDEHTRGGGPLLSNGAFRCTSGFTVRAGNGTTGVATAGHCTGLNQYRQPSDNLTYSTTFQAQHYGFWGDFEWHTTPHIEPAEFFATSTQVRQVNSIDGWLPVGTPSCVYGRSSNARACDTVYSNFVITTMGNGTTHWFLMAMTDDNTIPGDSGGPWSFATIADGIHKGDITLGGARRNMWSRADLLPISLGVSVRTQ